MLFLRIKKYEIYYFDEIRNKGGKKYLKKDTRNNNKRFN